MGLPKLSCLLIGTLLFTACTSQEEQKERRENSFDISGAYEASTSAGSEVDLQFEISNESGRHDIVVSLTRLSPVTQKERDLISAQGLNADPVFSHFGNTLTFGSGYSNVQLDGGENISKDLGETSEFYVCSDEYKYDAQYTITYCLEGLARKDNRTLEGKLHLSWVRAEPTTIDGKPGTRITSDRASLSYRTDMSRNFYRQYFGAWSGDIYPLVEGINPAEFQSLEISESGRNFATRGAGAFVEVGRELFEYDEVSSRDSLSSLQTPEFPAIQMVFRGPNGKRVVMFGQIWSLGGLTGTIVLIDGPNQTDLATFNLKKL